LAAATVAVFAVRSPGRASLLDLLVLCAAVVFSAVTLHYTVDAGVFTWALTEAAVGVAAGVRDGRWGAFAMVAGLLTGYCLMKMRASPLRGLGNSAAYSVGGIAGLACASSISLHPELSAPVRGAVAAGVTSVTVLFVNSSVIAYYLRRPWRDAVRIGLKADCVHAVAGALAGAAMSWLVSADVLGAVVAVTAATVLFPVLSSLRAARAECEQLRATLAAATDLLTAPDSASAEAALLGAASRVTGTSTVRLVDSTLHVPDLITTVPVPTTTRPRLSLVTDAREDLPLRPPLRAMLTTLAYCAGVALDAARQGQHWRHLAEHDPLTGLLNRRAFAHAFGLAVEHAANNDTMLAVVFVDLNGFKAVNDTHGHDAGDRVLKAVATRLRQVTREHDLCARLGGDEFCLALVGQPFARTTDDVEQRVRAAVAHVSHDLSAVIACSIGIAVFPDDAREPDQLVAIADARMYDDKNQRINDIA
jgi:diguanylate cyclase (GGDEF)-like protein